MGDTLEASDLVKKHIVNGRKQGKKYVMTFRMDGGSRIQIKVDPINFEMTVRKLGKDRKNGMTVEDHNFLKELALFMETHRAIDTQTVDSLSFQTSRTAGLLRDWHLELDLDFEFDKETEMDHIEAREEEERDHPTPKDAPAPGDGTSRQRRLGSLSVVSTKQRQSMVVRDEHGRRRLAYDSACDKMNSYVAVTHDSWGHSRWDDKGTFFAYVSKDPPCSTGDAATWFLKDGSWQCYEPDHDKNVEYAYGGCFGRCGAGCGDNGEGSYTYDCLDHDSCVRFGHSLTSFWCNDEFLAAADDYLFAPNC